ncbi:MAG: hypothetical protein ACXU8Z_20210, partial [Caulobacteraceae bacterium]
MPSERLQLRAEGGDLRAQVALAAALDEEGRHEQAIDWLARAGKTGDGEALRILGLRLLTGENAPHLPAQGARMLADAARAGDAGAAAVASVLLGGGFFAPQNWRIALDYLRMAAELGDPDAREQLLLLAGDAALARQVRGGAGVTEPLRRLRESIDMADWTRAPEPKVLN